MNLNTKMVISALVVVLAVAGSYFFADLSRTEGLKSGGIIKVEDRHKVSALMGVATLRALARQEFPADRSAGGPGLAYVLETAGVGRCREVEITGLGARSVYRAGPGDLAGDILYLTAGGRVDLCPKGDCRRFLVRNVSVIDKVD